MRVLERSPIKISLTNFYRFWNELLRQAVVGQVVKNPNKTKRVFQRKPVNKQHYFQKHIQYKHFHPSINLTFLTFPPFFHRKILTSNLHQDELDTRASPAQTGASRLMEHSGTALPGFCRGD